MGALTAGRARVAVALAAAVLLGAPQLARADPPGPTDFVTTIVAVEPAVSGVSASIVAGDAFFALDVERGISVTVTGYQGEPYLEFLPSGEVRENRQSPTYFASRTRSGADVPAGVTADTPPAWTRVATDGSYAWHDHRTHWMGGDPPGDRGDVVWESAVPLVVDGRSVAVQVSTRWLPAASPLPALAGLLAGALGAVGYVVSRRRGVAVLVVAAAVATAIGMIAHRSVPAVTGPSPAGWALPATALLAALVAWASDQRMALVALGARLLAGVELVIWSGGRRSGLLAAVLPTDAPFWLDRAVTAGVAVVGLTAAGLALVRLVELVTRPPVSPAAVESATAPPPART